jgi:hypothetical protein
MPHYVCALPNKKGSAPVQEFISDDPAAIEAWAREHDKPGWGVFDCHNPLKAGATRRSKETIGAIECIYADVDPKNITESMEEVDARLADFLLPLENRTSGRGRHLGGKLKEPIDPNDTEMVVRVDAVRKRLTEIFCGDPQVCQQAALRRRPGTHNTKDGIWEECKILANEGVAHDLTEWEEALALYDRPLLTPKPPVTKENVDYIDFGVGAANKPPIDVDARLAAMRYQGPGNTGINITWWECMGSLLRHGASVTDTLDRLYAAAQANCQDDPAKANWMRTLAGMAERWLKHEPQFLIALDGALYKAWSTAVAEKKMPRLIWRNAFGLYVRSQATAEPQTFSAAAVGDDSGATVTPLARPQPNIRAKPFQRFDPAQLPAREWLYDGHYQRGVVTCTVGPGGSGKSSEALVEMIAMATARNLLGEQPHERCRAWYHNAEDSTEEIYRRIGAICQHYGIDQSELEGWLFVTSGIEMPIRVTVSRNGKATIDAQVAEEIVRTITENDIGVSSFDPLIAHHNSTENATEDMDQLAREFARMADATNCSIELVHHTRKPGPGQDELSVMDSRGAIALINAVRSARVLNAMSKAESEKAGVDEIDRRLHFRVDNGKGNMVPPTAAQWRKFVSIDLPNGDNVGVVVPWTFPGQGDAAAGPEAAKRAELAETVFLQVLARYIESGRIVSDRDGKNFAPRMIAKEREAKLAKVTKVALDDAMRRLFERGKIKVESFGPPSRLHFKVVMA